VLDPFKEERKVSNPVEEDEAFSSLAHLREKRNFRCSRPLIETSLVIRYRSTTQVFGQAAHVALTIRVMMLSEKAVAKDFFSEKIN
jgi:hypothetical protein